MRESVDRECEWWGLVDDGVGLGWGWAQRSGEDEGFWEEDVYY